MAQLQPPGTLSIGDRGLPLPTPARLVGIPRLCLVQGFLQEVLLNPNTHPPQALTFILLLVTVELAGTKDKFTKI